MEEIEMAWRGKAASPRKGGHPPPLTLDMYDMNWRNMAPVCYAMGPWYLEVMWYAVKAMAMRLRYATAPSPSTTSFARHLNRALAPPPQRQDQERPRPSHPTIDDVEGGG